MIDAPRQGSIRRRDTHALLKRGRLVQQQPHPSLPGITHPLQDLACTSDVLSNPGTCTAACVTADVVACEDADGCCPDACEGDTDCTLLARIKQTALTDDGDEA